MPLRGSALPGLCLTALVGDLPLSGLLPRNGRGDGRPFRDVRPSLALDGCPPQLVRVLCRDQPGLLSGLRHTDLPQEHEMAW